MSAIYWHSSCVFTPWKVHHPSPVSCQVENPWLARNQYTLLGEFTAAQCRLPLFFATKFKTICILWCVLAPRTLTNPPTKRVWRPLRNKGEVFLHFIFKLPQINTCPFLTKPLSFSLILLKTQFVNSLYISRVNDDPWSWQYHYQTVYKSLKEIFTTYFVLIFLIFMERSQITSMKSWVKL